MCRLCLFDGPGRGVSCRGGEPGSGRGSRPDADALRDRRAGAVRRQLDSLQRGEGNNPFGNYKDLEPLANKNATGPFPGDEALFSFNLYTNGSLETRAGTAIFTCQYNLNKTRSVTRPSSWLPAAR